MLQPPIHWAQRSDNIYITIPLRDFKEDKIEILEKSLIITGKSDNKEYNSKINLYGEVNPSECKTQLTGFQLLIQLSKKQQDQPFWPRITEEKTKFNNITVDWNKYVDEDDEKEEAGKGLNDWNQDQMNQYGGQDQDQDSDDEEQEQEKLNDLDDDEEVQPEQKND